MKFGKEIQAQQIPGWSRYYLDYKFLKKIISSLAANRPAAEAAALAAGIRPGDAPLSPSATPRDDPVMLPGTEIVMSDAPTIESTIWVPGGKDDGRGPIFKAHKKAFFFKLERELEKINVFYLQKEKELRLRLNTLLSKRHAALERSRRQAGEDGAPMVAGVEWRAVEEGFRALQKDLGKLQQFIEINATGFRKILKKWDKRSKSHTKELYLSRQVEVQPCFDRQLLAELANIVASSLLDLEHPPDTGAIDGDSIGDVEAHQSALERQAEAAYSDFETTLSRLIVLQDEAGVHALQPEIEALLRQRPADAKTHITRILWKAIIDAPPRIADLLISSTEFDFSFVDDISGRSCLHEAAIAGEARLLSMCLEKHVSIDLQDVYGRTALQYAAMNGHAAVCEQLLRAGAKLDIQDADNCTPLVYAVMNGKVDCVRILLNQPGVTVDASTTNPDEYNLLALACQHGHAPVAHLLLEHGARRLPNSNGEYPLHLAAREGHAELCRMLVEDGLVKDMPDKYSQWTPLFHAARNGHEACVRILLEAGCNPNLQDETGKTAVFYAAWQGHISCVNLLIQAGSPTGPRASAPSVTSLSPASEIDDGMLIDGDGDVDAIPSLSLPPPAMPFRIYGHSYLNRSYLVQIALGRPFSVSGSSTPVQAVQLHSRVTGAPYFHSGPSLKLVMTTRPDVNAAPHTVILPLQDEREVFNFHLESLKDLSLEFSLYPAYGSKLVGRAVTIPSATIGRHMSEAVVLPIMDHRLQVVGQVSFELCIITPFSGVRLEIGGAVETYWKSTAVPQAAAPSVFNQARLATLASTPRATSTSGSGVSNLTVSSLAGDYVHAVVQVTRDMVPVVFADWRLPIDEHDLSVADVTYAEFVRLAQRKGKTLDASRTDLTSAAAWHSVVSQSLVSLEDFLKALPLTYGVSIELAYASLASITRLGFGRSHDVNRFIDAVLQTVYDVSASRLGPISADGLQSRRKVVFSSFSPDVCVALNWKQPNYAVLFASRCGVRPHPAHSDEEAFVADESEDDRRCKSVGAAVDFAKSNNLLGVVLHASLLARVPSLIRGVKETGVIMAAFGDREDIRHLGLAGDSGPTVDAILQDGVVRYMDHALRAVV